jgi:predicted TIM-barrel fold metal-dependent hydrolase
MNVPAGAIDCDIHPAVPRTAALLPYLDEFWRDQIVTRYIDRAPFTLMSYPPNSPISARADWRPVSEPPGSDLGLLCAQALDAFGTRIAICNVLHGAAALFNEDMAAALCRAVNDYVARELLDREPRLRASILVPAQNPELAATEIERVAPDRRFVQVLLFAMGDMLLGRRANWSIYRAAEKNELAIGIHAGSLYRHPPTASGWTSFQVEDQVGQGVAFQNQLVSLLAEGVFQEFPTLKFVCLESGFAWLPTLLWRTNKTWRGTRQETPWINRPPADIIRERVRFTLQPVDTPPALLARLLDHIGSDEMLLFSTDYPHWHFDGDDVVPEGLPKQALRRMIADNALATYPRLRSGASVGIASHKETVP